MVPILLSATLLFSTLPLIAAEAEVAAADSIRKYRFLAKTARDKKAYGEAAGYYRQYLKYKPDDQKGHYFLGKVLYQQKKLDEARLAFRQSIALDSLHVNSNLMLHGILTQQNKPDSAALALERVLKAKPADKNTRNKLADLYRRQNKPRPAIVHYEYLLEKDQQNPELLEMLAVLHRDLGEPGQALKWRQRLMEVQASADSGGVDSAKLKSLESVVDLKEETGDLSGAYEGLVELARLDGPNRYAHYNRAAQLAERQNNESMRISALKGMAKANPKDLETVATLAEWYMKREKLADAHDWIERGLKVEAQHPHLQLLLGDYLLTQGDEEGALAAYEIAKGDPSWQTVAQQRIWQLRPPETNEEKLKREFFGKKEDSGE